ncbi:MAG: hypothetical protein LBO00_01230 [Zoogloeaceae bacterium]|jgi:hypothetical protein|nr:hypothetical protein [Zoogloeaceae bacterium]
MSDHPLKPQPLPTEQADQIRQAAEQLRDIIRENVQFELNYDEESVRWLDGYIERMRLGTQEHEGAIKLIGSFLGECLIRNFGGQWIIYDGMYGVAVDDGNISFPYNKTTKQYANGAEKGDSILGFYRVEQTFRTLNKPKPLTPVQDRLLDFFQRGCRVFVFSHEEWKEIEEIDGHWLTFRKEPSVSYTMSIALTQIDRFYACSSDGRLLHTEWITKSDWETLPAEILEQVKQAIPADTTTLTLDQLESGKRFVEIEYGESPRKEEESGYRFYSTSLKNISARKIKITRFGGYRLQDGAWRLASVTGNFYSADEFKDWYHDDFDIWSQQEGAWLMPGDVAYNAANWGEPPVLWAYFGVADTGESFIAGKVLEKPIAVNEDTAHYVRPERALPEMEEALFGLRRNWMQWQQRANSFSVTSMSIPRPSWMSMVRDDGLEELFRQQGLLLREGKIMWAALIQANSLLFKPGDDDCPAGFVYSPDTYFDSRPQELRLIGRKIFSFKGTNPSDPKLQEVARRVTDEEIYTMGFTLPKVFSDKEIRWITTIVCRRHIPKGILSSGLYPVLVHPSTRAAMIVPCQLWPAGFSSVL